jgi:cytidylate kinase
MNRQQPRSLNQIIDDQFRLWAEGAKQAKSQQLLPLITISRQYGALGTTIGRQLSEKMGFALWDQELVHAIAEDSGVSENLIRSFDEQWPNTLNEIISSLVIGPKGTEAEYVRQIHRIVHTLEKHGKGIIIGRGAQFIVKSHRAFKLRFVAPLQTRIERVMAAEKLDNAAALKKITSVDRERTRFHKRYFSQDLEDPCHYHLVLNTGALPAVQAANIVSMAYQEHFGLKL